jgi:uncharacterized protein (TIGR02444 family)
MANRQRWNEGERDSMNPAETEAFWQFSLAIYARPGVAERCIALQDGAGRDVNLLLLALYAGLKLGRRLDAGDFAALEEAVAGWTEAVTAKLRAVRRALKPSADDAAIAALRKTVQDAELDAERLAQRLLLAALPEGAAELPGADLARANLAAYAGPDAAALAAVAL